MEKLFSPWRSQYIASFSQPSAQPGQCVLCIPRDPSVDDERLIVTRGRHSFVIMNLYPYNSGHLMIVPYRHTSTLEDLTEGESAEIMAFLKTLTRALKAVSHPDGFNIGSNIGRTAGAGIDQHLHFHIVPRWSGDTNFMPVLADTKMISEDMKETLVKLRKALAAQP